MGENNSKASNRKRGVSASRVKLEQAMLKAGFKTQSALAAAIAINESLNQDNPPRDMVNRVFREISVDPHTLERVANALNVSAYTLMLSSEEKEQLDQSTIDSQLLKDSSPKSGSKTHTRMSLRYFAGSAFLAIVASLFYFDFLTDFSDSSPSNPNAQKFPISIALIKTDSITLPKFQQYLTKFLGAEIQIKTSDIQPISSQVQPWELAERLNVDYVLHLETLTKGRYQAVFLNLINSNNKQPVYSNAWTKQAVSNQSLAIAKNSSSAIRTFLKLKNEQPSLQSSRILNNNSDQVEQIVSVKAISAYMAGLDMLDGPFSNFYLNQSVNQLNRALRLTPTFDKARAGLCNALTALYVSSKDISLLSDAENECLKVSEKGKLLAEYHAAIAHLYRRQGKLNLAETHYNLAIDKSKYFINSMLGLGETYILLANKTQDKSYFNKGIELVKRAENIDPNYWKSSFVRGRIHYYNGDPKSAIEANEKSISIKKYYPNTNNLANMHYCFGDPVRTKELYLEASQMKHSPPLAQYQLGSIYGFFEQYSQAAQAMDNYHKQIISEGNQVSLDAWLGMADIYQLNHEVEKAKKAYQSGYQEAEKLRLNGDDSPGLKVKLLHLRLNLASIDKINLSEEKQQSYLNQLDLLNSKITNPNTKLNLILSYMILEEWDKAKTIYQQVAPICKGFADSPDFSKLN